jgi:hydroxyethylthiazole kinase
MGCAGTAVLTALLVVEPDAFLAAAAALLVLGVAGERAGAVAHGPGTFPAAFLDALDALDAAALARAARIG